MKSELLPEGRYPAHHSKASPRSVPERSLSSYDSIEIENVLTRAPPELSSTASLSSLLS